MGYDEDEAAADPESLRRYIDQRADMLRIVLMNHLFWEAALRTAGAEGRIRRALGRPRRTGADHPHRSDLPLRPRQDSPVPLHRLASAARAEGQTGH